MYQPSEELLDRLASPDVTAAEVFEYLRGQEAELMSPVRGHFNCKGDAYVMPPAPIAVTDFFNAADLDSYRAAREWWPKHPDLPHRLAFPSIYQLCYAYHDPAQGTTFAWRLTERAQPVMEWLTEMGYDVNNPNETQEERRQRQNREAQARRRLRKGEAGTPEQQAHALAVKEAYDRWQERVAARTQNAEAYAAKVQEAQAAYHAVCEERRKWREWFDKDVKAARDRYLALKKSPPAGGPTGEVVDGASGTGDVADAG